MDSVEACVGHTEKRCAHGMYEGCARCAMSTQGRPAPSAGLPSAHLIDLRSTPAVPERFLLHGRAGGESQMTSSNRAREFNRQGGDTVWQHWLLTRAAWEGAARPVWASTPGQRV